MQNSQFNPAHMSDFSRCALNLNAQGIIGVAIAGISTNFDYKFIDDHLLTGIEYIVSGSNWGDSMTLQIVDKDGIFAPAGTILNQFATNWYLSSIAIIKDEIRSCYPAKIPTGLYLRLIYNSTGTTNVNFAINLEIHKVMM
jgi:hypothetical protein